MLRSIYFKLATVVVVAMASAGAPAAITSTATSGSGPTFKFIGPLAFGPDGVLFAADSQDVSIHAIQLGKAATGGAPGTKAVPAIDRKIAALLGTDARTVRITDMAVNPMTGNTFLSAIRGEGATARSVLLRVDGDGTIDVVATDQLRYSKVALPNAPPAATELHVQGQTIPIPNYPDKVDFQGPGAVQTITHMAYSGGKLYVAGLSSEEFASKLRVIPYPFKAADEGTSVEIYHGSHGQLETFSPIFTFVPYTIDGQPSIVASYLCTPLVKFPLSALTAGNKVRGTTIAELGNRNRPIDMIVYQKNGQDFLLMSNNMRGVMKVPTAPFGKAAGITKQVPESDTAGVPYETVASLKGVQQLDRLDQQHAVLLVESAGALNLEAVALP